MRDTLKLFVFWVVMLIPVSMFAQDKGNLRGTIKDNTGGTLPGASVSIKGSTLGTASNMDGEYVLQGIPVGEVNIEVNYLGYKQISETITITAGKTVSRDFIMQENSYELGDIVISAAVSGQQRALNQQKVADNLMQVISADEIGKFPDPNVSDALKRLSGITTDGKEVQLRGTPVSLISI